MSSLHIGIVHGAEPYGLDFTVANFWELKMLYQSVFLSGLLVQNEHYQKTNNFFVFLNSWLYLRSHKKFILYKDDGLVVLISEW